jgi:hypothetical protein
MLPPVPAPGQTLEALVVTRCPRPRTHRRAQCPAIAAATKPPEGLSLHRWFLGPELGAAGAGGLKQSLGKHASSLVAVAIAASWTLWGVIWFGSLTPTAIGGGDRLAVQPTTAEGVPLPLPARPRGGRRGPTVTCSAALRRTTGPPEEDTGMTALLQPALWQDALPRRRR